MRLGARPQGRERTAGIIARETIARRFRQTLEGIAGRMSFEPKAGPQGALYQRIRNDLEASIMSGAWPPGHRVPFEHELMETYSCSRMTVNKVLSALADAGLVVRRRRAGSFVSRPRVQSAILQIPDLKAEVEKRGERYGYRLLELRKRAASAHDKARLGVGGRARRYWRCAAGTKPKASLSRSRIG